MTDEKIRRIIRRSAVGIALSALAYALWSGIGGGEWTVETNYRMCWTCSYSTVAPKRCSAPRFIRANEAAESLG